MGVLRNVRPHAFAVIAGLTRNLASLGFPFSGGDGGCPSAMMEKAESFASRFNE